MSAPTLKLYRLIYIRREPVGPGDPDYAEHGYGDYPRTSREDLGTVQAETERKAQGLFKKRFPERGLVFSKRSPVCPFWIEEVTSEPERYDLIPVSKPTTTQE